ncbi:MAG TPA: glycosyltransferase family 2 protein [Jiangellales bacterium]|nr:glycosyltransferase family 2 protein [Jiangellales bacterium]
MPTDPIHPLHAAAPSVYEDPGYGADQALDAFAQPDAAQPPVDPHVLAQQHVTAVLVAHDGERWLPQVLEALGGLTYPPDRIIAVDTGSRDSTPALLAQALGGPAVMTQPKRTGFGAAIQAGLHHADRLGTDPRSWQQRTEWIWLLHDDCAPAPDALLRLLETAVRRPDAAVIGPKIRGWRDERQLLEVGLTMTGGGRRHTGLEKLEYDQGQHDTTREVLAVGSAGMLVRRDVWEELGGFDRNLAIFRDDIDFGWRTNLAGHSVLVCPDAVVQHAEAAAHGRRRLGATRDRAHLVDRRNAIYVSLANAPARRWLFTLLRMITGAVGRAVGFLLGKQPALAAEEIFALLSVLARPDRLVRARVQRSRTRNVAPAELKSFFPSASQQLRTAVETVLAVVTGTGSGHDLPSRRRAVTDPDSEDDEPAADDAWWLKALLKPPVLLVAALVAITLIASRRLIGMGRLSGGALFPAPDSTAAVWASYTDAWHGVGLGSATPAPPYLAIVGVLSWLLRSPSLVVDLLLIGSVPLAALTAYLLLRRLVQSHLLRIWGAALYGLLPATTGTIAAGRLGTAVAAIMLPLIGLAVLRTLGTAERPGPVRAAWSAGLLLAIVVAFVPIAWVAALGLGVAVVAIRRTSGALLRMLALLSVAPAVLAPWSLRLLGSPGLLLAEAGAAGPGLSDPDLAPWSVLLQNPGGPGAAPVWLGVALLLASWAGLFRATGRGLVVAGWAVAGVGLVLGLVVSRLPVRGGTLETPVAGWPGFATVLLGGGLVLAGVGAASGLRQRLAEVSFGWRQPLAVLLVVAAAITPVVAAGWWVIRGADDPLARQSPAVLPAYVVEEGELPDRIRTLVLTRTDDGRVTYALLRQAGPRLGDAETGPAPEHNAALEEVVGDVVSGRGGADGSALADFAARYVYVPAPADPALVDVLDTVPGLARASAPPEAAMWRVETDVARVRVLGGADGVVRVASAPVDAGSAIPADPESDGRLLVLAERVDPGWLASLAGDPLTPTTHNGWAQAFELPPAGGEVVVSYDGGRRETWLTVQLIAVLVAVVLALPGMRRQKGAIEGAAHDTEYSTGPEVPAVGTRRAARLREPEPVGVGTQSRPAPGTPPEYMQPAPAGPGSYPVEYGVPPVEYGPAPVEYGPPAPEYAEPAPGGYAGAMPDQYTVPIRANSYPEDGRPDPYGQSGEDDSERVAGEPAARTGGGRRKGGRRARRGGALSDTVDSGTPSRRSESKGGRRAKGRRRRGGDS